MANSTRGVSAKRDGREVIGQPALDPGAGVAARGVSQPSAGSFAQPVPTTARFQPPRRGRFIFTSTCPLPAPRHQPCSHQPRAMTPPVQCRSTLSLAHQPPSPGRCTSPCRVPGRSRSLLPAPAGARSQRVRRGTRSCSCRVPPRVQCWSVVSGRAVATRSYRHKRLPKSPSTR